MNLRKRFNIQDKAQKSFVLDEVNSAFKLAVQESAVFDFEQKIIANDKDYTCPKCNNKNKDEIVDKMHYVKGEPSGFGIFGSGVKINTSAVNHCRTCGNEWEKYKPQKKYCTDIIRDWVQYSAIAIKENANPKLVLPKELHSLYAESIYDLYKKFYVNYNHLLGATVKKFLTVKNLRENFQSVFDAKVITSKSTFPPVYLP